MLVPTSVWAITANYFYVLQPIFFVRQTQLLLLNTLRLKTRTRSVSLLVRLAVNLGFSVGPAIGGFIALYLGCKWLFVIDAAYSVSSRLLVVVYLSSKTENACKT
ncbi:MAG: hypothetical protein IPJ66_08975 [Bacteroidetes bacterium]|nr:hypothetical protein [Bacteroidota bacterium]